MNFFSSARICADNNPKVVTLIYIWDGKQVEFELCEQCRKDPNFDNFISEIPLNVIKKETEGLSDQIIPSVNVNTATEAM